jgi:hypothetical protein
VYLELSGRRERSRLGGDCERGAKVEEVGVGVTGKTEARGSHWRWNESNEVLQQVGRGKKWDGWPSG